MKQLSFTMASLPYYVPSNFDEMVGRGPRRKSLVRPSPNGRFVLPVRQSLVMDARLMPGTTRLLMLLAGWGGSGRSIDTTLGALGRNLSRSSRQIQRYLRDAAEEGYLYFRQITNRFGYVVGLRISLCKSAIYAPKRKAPDAQEQRPWVDNYAARGRRNPATTQESGINKNTYIILDRTDPLDRKLASLGECLGIPIQT